MGRASRRKRERSGRSGQSEAPHLPPWIQALVDDVVRLEPELCRSLPAAVACLMGPECTSAFNRASAMKRAGLLLAWRHAPLRDSSQWSVVSSQQCKCISLH
jgi:hypothetical protein